MTTSQDLPATTAVRSWTPAQRFAAIFGVVYLLVALLGFYYGNHPLIGMVEHNHADIWLHIAIAAAALFLGFTGNRDASTTTS